MPKDACPTCCGVKDARAMQCHPCRMRLNRPSGRKAIGWHTNPGGYLIASLDGHHVCYQHRYVMERHLGRKLTTREHVHHLNGDRTDNRIENLEVIDASEHARRHATPERMRTMSKLGHRARWGV